MASRDARTKANDSPLTSNAYPVPTAAMTRPATPGPMSRPALNEALLRATALVSRSFGTISETNDWRAGLSTAVATPWRKAMR
jgi:hypothetical protein